MRMSPGLRRAALITLAAAVLPLHVLAQDPFPDFGRRFTQYSGNPLLSLESSNPWNFPRPGEPYDALPGTIHPDVLYFPEGQDGYKFWMVFTPYEGFAQGGTSTCPPWSQEECPPYPWSDPIQYWERLTIMRSNDGVNWTGTGIANPVISPEAGPCTWNDAWDHGVHYDPDLVYAPGRGPDGESWFLYFAVVNYCSGARYIGLAMSKNGVEWEKFGPVMPLGATPSVVFDHTGFSPTFYAWYLVNNAEGGKLGFATSPNGIDWTPYCPSGSGCWTYPVFEPIPGTCDQGGITHQDVIKRGNEFWMYYQASPHASGLYHDLMIRRATSTDGINWTRDPGAVLSTSKILTDWPACPTSNPVPPDWTFWDRSGPAWTPSAVTLLYRPSAVPVGDAMYLYFGGLNKKDYWDLNSDRDIGVAFSSRFSDVPPVHWAYAAIEAVAKAGLTSGCGNNNFCPDVAAKRKEAATFIALADELPLPPYDNRFCDVPNDAYAPYILALDNAGVVGAPQGCGLPCPNPTKRRFCPNLTASRLDLGILTYEALGLTPWTGAPHFIDVPAAYQTRLDRLYHEGIASGCYPEHYCPDNPATRAMLAVFTAAGFLEP
jgi:S-layer family protein